MVIGIIAADASLLLPSEVVIAVDRAVPPLMLSSRAESDEEASLWCAGCVFDNTASAEV